MANCGGAVTDGVMTDRPGTTRRQEAKVFSALQLIFLFFLQENELRKALIPFIGVRTFGRASFSSR